MLTPSLDCRPVGLPVVVPPGRSGGTRVADIHVVRYLARLGPAYAAKTKSALRSDWRCFCRWCAEGGFESFPATPAAVIGYLEAKAAQHSLATLKRRLATLSHLHDAFGAPNPARMSQVRLTMRGLARLKGARPEHRRAPLREEDVEKILAILGPSLRDTRDRAILLTARDSLARRAELAGLHVADLEWRRAGDARALLQQTKNDPAGRVAWLSPRTVAAVKDWLERAAIAEGPVFRQVVGKTKIGPGLEPEGISDRLKVLAAAAGIDPRRIGGHSTRLGMCVDLVADGASLVQVQLAGGWSDPKMPGHYAADLLPELGPVAHYHRARA